MKRAAVFFDRDNTLIVSDGYLGDPSGVKLVDGAADAVARAHALGYVVVTLSNQSGVAKGLFPEDAVHAVNLRLEELLREANPQALIDRHEYCPFHPEATVDRYRLDSDLRKPKPGMLLRAAKMLELDLARSWVIGDAPRDIEAGRAAGCRTILFHPSDLSPSPAASADQTIPPDATAATLDEAMSRIASEAPPRTSPDPAPGNAEVGNVGGADSERAESVRAGSVHAASAGAGVTRGVATPSDTTSHSLPFALAAPSNSVFGLSPALDRPILAEAQAGEVNPTPGNFKKSAPQASAASPAHPAAPAGASPSVRDESLRATPPMTRAGPDASRLEKLAEQILFEVRRRNEHSHADFSVSKLLAGVSQAIAIACLIGAYFLRDRTLLEPWLLVGLTLQTLTLTLLAMGREH